MYDEMKELVKALELDRAGNWHEAHAIVQEMSSRDGCLVHAYLHREEGDLGNAHYWYSRAKSKIPSISLEAEWLELYKRYNLQP